MKYYRKNGRWYRQDNTILSLEDIAYMLINTKEKVKYKMWIAIYDGDIRIWNTNNKPI